MNDKKILELFRTGQREKAFTKLYGLYPKIEALIISKGGQKQDASDVFQEALIILNRNLETSDFKLTASFYTYLYAVSRFVWKDFQKKISRHDFGELTEIEETCFLNTIEEEKYRRAEHAFRKLGERCQQLLQLFYHKAMSFKNIAEVMQFKSEKVAKNQKYKCLAKAKDNYQVSKTIQS